MKNVNLLLAFGGGVILGALAGVLLAPEKGSDTRRRILHLLKDEKQLLKEELQEFLESKGIEIPEEELCEIFENYGKYTNI